MKKNIISADKETNIIDAAKIMSKNDVGSLLVTDKDKTIGIITQTDLLKRVVAKNRNLKTTKIKHVMSKKLLTVPSNTSIKNLTDTMAKLKVKHITITDNKRILGIITSTDIIKLMSGHFDRKITIRDKEELNPLIKTGADMLLDLVNKKKKISINKAANLLGVSEVVVKEWAEYIEEESDLIKLESKGNKINIILK